MTVMSRTIQKREGVRERESLRERERVSKRERERERHRKGGERETVRNRKWVQGVVPWLVNVVVSELINIGIRYIHTIRRTEVT